MVLTNRALSVSMVWAVAFLILQRKDTEERFAQKQDELQTIFDSAPAMIWYKDKANRILNVNKGAAQSIGVPEHQIKGRLTDEFYPEDALKYHQDDLEVMQTGEPKRGIIEPYHVSADEKRWVQTDKIPYRDAQGNILGVIVFAVDITDRIRAEEALHHANEQLEVRVTEALAKLKVLRGLLPICASCKQIRDDQGYWDSVESYIQTHSEATFTHSICPNCMRKPYPDIDIAKMPKP
jgi:PAS domain S-box-containing protein